MSELHFAWLELSILTPLLGAAAVSRLRDPERAQPVSGSISVFSIRSRPMISGT
jgi:hypothetical protein